MPTYTDVHDLPKPNGNEAVSRANHIALVDAVEAALISVAATAAQPRYQVQVCFATDPATLADFNAAADVYGLGEHDAVRGSINWQAPAHDDDTELSFLFSMVVAVDAETTVNIPIILVDDTLRLYVDGTLNDTWARDVNTVRTKSLTLAAGERVIQWLFRNNGGGELGVLVGDWFNAHVNWLRAATA